MTKYYAAYGSNLCKAQMKLRCPKARPLGAVELPKAQLIFNGVADVVFHETKTAMIGLWEITDACEHTLDGYEGVISKETGKPFKCGAYRKETIRVIVTEDGEQVERDALIYVMNKDHRQMPMLTYLNTIKEGFRDFGLDEQWLREALKDTAADIKKQAAENKVRWEREDAERARQKSQPQHYHTTRRSPHKGITNYYDGPNYNPAQAAYYDRMQADEVDDLFRHKEVLWDDGQERPTPTEIMDELAREEMIEMSGLEHPRRLRTEQDYRDATAALAAAAKLQRETIVARHDKSGYKVPKTKSPHLFQETRYFPKRK